MDGPTSFPELLRPWVQEKWVRIKENEIEFDEVNSTIKLIQIRTEEDSEKARGQEKHVLVLDEATQIAKRHIESLRAWVRMPKEMKDKLPDQIRYLYPTLSDHELKEMFPRIIYTANPEGASVSYFRKQFVEPREPFAIERALDKEGGFMRQYIPSRIDDNPSADKEAQRRRLSGLGEARAKALIEGSWDAPTGDYFKEYDDDRHVVPDFIPENHLFKFRSIDWGNADPCAVYWITIADGDDITARDGTTFWVPSGSMVVYREWYICDPENPEKGLRMRNHDIAQGILNRTPEATSNITISDGWPFSDRGESSVTSKKHTIADVFAEAGVLLVRGNLQRIQGWAQMRDRLIGIDGYPLLYLTESCHYARDYIPALPHSDTRPEDAAESGESTHSCDALRIACTARPVTIRKDDTKDAKKNPFTPLGILNKMKPTKRKLQ